VNAKVSFDEFLAMKKAQLLYISKYDPQVIYEYGLHLLDPEDPKDFAKMPEYYMETEEFREEALVQYRTLTHEHLLEKQWFKKVDALELFGEFQDYGRGGKWIPKHNAYTPAPTIMPIPKF